MEDDYTSVTDGTDAHIIEDTLSGNDQTESQDEKETGRPLLDVIQEVSTSQDENEAGRPSDDVIQEVSTLDYRQGEEAEVHAATVPSGNAFMRDSLPDDEPTKVETMATEILMDTIQDHKPTKHCWMPFAQRSKKCKDIMKKKQQQKRVGATTSDDRQVKEAEFMEVRRTNASVPGGDAFVSETPPDAQPVVETMTADNTLETESQKAPKHCWLPFAQRSKKCKEAKKKRQRVSTSNDPQPMEGLDAEARQIDASGFVPNTPPHAQPTEVESIVTEAPVDNNHHRHRDEAPKHCWIPFAHTRSKKCKRAMKNKPLFHAEDVFHHMMQ